MAFHSQAIPALIALGLAQGAHAAPACSVLDGEYRFKPEIQAENPEHPLSLSVLAGFGVNKLYRRVPPPQGGRAVQTRLEPLADRVSIKYAPGATLARFFDAKGKELGAFNVDAGGPWPWTCRDGKLQRVREQSRGIENTVRYQRIVLSIERDGAALLMSETVVTLDPVGIKPRRHESRFRALR